MSEKTLKILQYQVNKKEFHKSKPPIDLHLINVDQIQVSDKSIVMIVSSILLVTKKVKLLSCYVLSYLT